MTDGEFCILKISIYSLKSRFQAFLKPIIKYFIKLRITPNQVTIFTCLLCVFYSSLLAWSPYTKALLLLFPVLMFIRMALNALDGMLAQETNNKTPMGAVLNELCDVISDVALLSSFLVLLTGVVVWWWLLTILCVLTEFVSLAVYQSHGMRPQSGPFGKSDRAVYLGLISILLVIFPEAIISTPLWLIVYIAIGIVLSGFTIWNRINSVDVDR